MTNELEKDLEIAKQKLTEIEKKLYEVQKGDNQHKDILNKLELDFIEQKINVIENLINKIDPEDVIRSKKGSKLKDR